MLVKELVTGKKVKAFKKSYSSESFEQFLERYPNGIASISSYDKEREIVHIDDWNFSRDDLISAEGIPLRPEDVKQDLVVRVIHNSFGEQNLLNFLSLYPNAIGKITAIVTIDDKNIHIYVNGIPFKIEDLVTDLGTTEEISSVDNINVITSIKPITIENLFKAGTCIEELSKFAQTVIQESVNYSYSSIPPLLAQKVISSLGYPKWLEEKGFIKITKKEVIKTIHVVDCNTYFDIRAIDQSGKMWYLFKVQKDGTGFSRYDGIRKEDLTTDGYGRIIEKAHSTDQ